MTLSEIVDAISKAGFEPYHQEEAGVIYCADCLEVLKYIPDKAVDLVLTDPPYGIGESNEKNMSRGGLATPTDYGHYEWDSSTASDVHIAEVLRTSKEQIVFGGNYYNLPPSSCWLIWDKDNGANDFADCELAWTSLSKAVRLKRYKWAGMLQERMGKHKEVRRHPTQKPTEVMSWAIQQTPESCNIILDPFLGSGTTAVAAKQLGRKFIGIEIEEKYCKIAVQRLAQWELF